MRNIFVLALLIVTFSVSAQYGRRDSNRIGISGGITQMDLFSNQFNATPLNGWTAGFSLRGNYYNDFQMAYGMHFTDSNFSLQSVTGEAIDYKMSALQIYLTGSYMIVENHLTVEFGPVLQINGELAIDEKDEKLLLKDAPLLFAEDITDVTKINGNAYVGITAGIKQVRLHVAYQYGFTNFMNNLNKDKELVLRNDDTKFKANIGLISGMITFYL
jgi:hypothetical protein